MSTSLESASFSRPVRAGPVEAPFFLATPKERAAPFDCLAGAQDRLRQAQGERKIFRARWLKAAAIAGGLAPLAAAPAAHAQAAADRQSVGEGKGVSVRVDLGGLRYIK